MTLCTLLPQGIPENFQSLTLPYLNLPNIIYYGYTSHEKLIGLCIAEINLLRHFISLKEFRIQNSTDGKAFMDSLKKEWKQQGFTFIDYQYLLEEPFTPDLESILKETQWEGPRLLRLSCYFEALRFRPAWFLKKYRFPENYYFSDWSSLNPEERHTLKRQVEIGVVPSSVDPFIDEESIDPLNTLLLRHHGKIIGWMITHRIDPETIKYSSLYVEREHHHKGIAILMLIESIKRQIAKAVPYALFEVNVVLTTHSWYKMVKNRLAPYSQKVTHIHEMWLTL